jgi:integrase
MARIKVRYLVAKQQKGGHVLYYWQPNEALREVGFLPRRLAESTNALADAVPEAERLNAEVDAWRAGRKTQGIRPETLPWLSQLYRSDPRYTDLAPKTQRSYDQCIRVIEAWSERAGHPPVGTIERKHVRGFYHAMMGTPAKANAVMRVLRILLAFAVDEGLISSNPAAKQRLKGRPPRQAVWKIDEVHRLCQTARDRGRPSIALAVLLAAGLGQREGDVLKLSWSQYDGTKIKLRQGKTGALVAVPVVQELKAALDAAPRTSPIILTSEVTGRPYAEDNFRHVFADIRAAAGLRHVWFMDLRRTAVVWLAEAGCEVYEIASITGHSLKQTVTILEVYLPRNATMARNAILKLEEYRRRTKLEGPVG